MAAAALKGRELIGDFGGGDDEDALLLAFQEWPWITQYFPVPRIAVHRRSLSDDNAEQIISEYLLM